MNWSKFFSLNAAILLFHFRAVLVCNTTALTYLVHSVVLTMYMVNGITMKY